MSDRPRHIVRLSDLPSRKRTHIQIEPDAAARADLAQALDVLTIRKLRLDGDLIPMGKTDWRLEGTLGATVQQACVVTLEPVTTRIDENILRTYSAHYEDPDGAEVEMPEDDTTEPLPETLNLIEVMAEALALSLPPFPRKDGAEVGVVNYTEPGKAAMTDEDARPFAGLAALRDSLETKDEDKG